MTKTIDFQNQWSSVFCGIVSRAMTLEVLSTGVAGNYNGALQVVLSTSICFSFQYQSNKIFGHACSFPKL